MILAYCELLPGRRYLDFDADLRDGIRTERRGARFHVHDLAPGAYTLNVSTVGYHLLRQDFTVTAGYRCRN